MRKRCFCSHHLALPVEGIRVKIFSEILHEKKGRRDDNALATTLWHGLQAVPLAEITSQFHVEAKHDKETMVMHPPRGMACAKDE